MQSEAWMKALAAWQGGDLDLALSTLDGLLRAFPENLQARHLDGVVRVATGDYDGAIDQLTVVCRDQPGNGDAHAALGNALRLAGRTVGAEAMLRAGLANNPENSALYFNLGLVLRQQQRYDESAAAFQRAVELDPGDQETWMQLGIQRYTKSDHAAAAAAFLQAAALGGEVRADAVRLAGFALADAGLPEQAEPLLASLCPPQPEETCDGVLLSQLLFCRLELCDWRRLSDMVLRCKEFVAAGVALGEPFTFQLLQEITPQEQLALTERFARGLIPHQYKPLPPGGDLDPARRLRLGYLSADFHDHAVMRLLAGVLERHNRQAFEIHAFSYGGDDDSDMRRRIVAACDAFHDVSPLAPQALAERIRAERIDILVDLSGWTGNTKTAAMGFRPAPVQVVWLGYSGTLGSRRLADYLIGDEVATPLADQGNFAETLALMPRCCQPNDAGRRIGPSATRAQHGLPECCLVFCCFSRPLKIQPDMFDCWCDLLCGLPGSVLWLLATNTTVQNRLREVAAGRGIDPGRLVFSVPLPPEQHLARLALADLALDTFPFGAHTTASDALWAGVPVLTRMGETFPSRVTASMLGAVGLDDMVCPSLDAYRARALELGRDVTALRALRSRLAASRLASPLFDTVGFAADLDALLRGMWQRHCAGLT